MSKPKQIMVVARLFVKVLQPRYSEVNFSFFKSSCHMSNTKR